MVKTKVLRSLQLLGLLLAVVFVAGCLLAASLGAASAPRVTQMQAINGRSVTYRPNVPAALNGDYLRAVSAEEGIYRWPANRLPLRVYIDDGSGVRGYRSNFSNLVRESFNEWCRLAQGKLAWTEVRNPQQADIICLWTDRPEARGGGVEAGETVTLARRGYNGSQIEAAKITILTQLAGKSFSDTDMRKTALHEVGHSLGLQGHSNQQSDIMYPSVNRAQVAYLTQRDANTINKLYSGYGNAPSIAQAPTYGRQYYQPAPAPQSGYGSAYGSGYAGHAPLYGGGLSYAGGVPNYGYQPMPSSTIGTMANGGRSALRQMAWDLARSIVQGALSR